MVDLIMKRNKFKIIYRLCYINFNLVCEKMKNN